MNKKAKLNYKHNSLILKKVRVECAVSGKNNVRRFDLLECRSTRGTRG